VTPFVTSVESCYLFLGEKEEVRDAYQSRSSATSSVLYHLAITAYHDHPFSCFRDPPSISCLLAGQFPFYKGHTAPVMHTYQQQCIQRRMSLRQCKLSSLVASAALNPNQETNGSRQDVAASSVMSFQLLRMHQCFPGWSDTGRHVDVSSSHHSLASPSLDCWALLHW
jgi:hypothetical protein